MECKKLLFLKPSSGGEGGGGLDFEEFLTTGDSLGSLVELVPVIVDTDVTTIPNETLIAEFHYTTNNSGRNVQLAVRLNPTSTVNSLFTGSYITSTGEELVIKLLVDDNVNSRLRAEVYKNGAFIENVGNTLAAKNSYCVVSRVTPGTGVVKIKRYMI